jgi:hypothetical protein
MALKCKKMRIFLRRNCSKLAYGAQVLRSILVALPLERFYGKQQNLRYPNLNTYEFPQK